MFHYILTAPQYSRRKFNAGSESASVPVSRYNPHPNLNPNAKPSLNPNSNSDSNLNASRIRFASNSAELKRIEPDRMEWNQIYVKPIVLTTVDSCFWGRDPSSSICLSNNAVTITRKLRFSSVLSCLSAVGFCSRWCFGSAHIGSGMLVCGSVPPSYSHSGLD